MTKLTFTLAFVLSSLFAFSQTVVDIIVGSDDHNTLEAAVIAAELDGALSGDGPFTVFAPTDAAFDLLPPGTVTELLQNPTGNLARILMYHVVGAEVMSTDLSDGQSATTLLGQNIEVSITSGSIFINGAEVSMANIPADNGVVHVLDAVILPPAATVVDVVVNSEVHTTLEAAVIAAELDDDLSADGAFTLFAPTDAAFDLLPAGTVDELLQDPTGDLANILLYHAVNGEVLSTDLMDGMTAPTLFNNQEIAVTINTDGVFINNAEVIIADIRTFNGVVHVLDAVLLPTTTAVKDLNEANIQIFPNPTIDELNITLPEEMVNQNLQMDLINATGQMMSSNTYNGENISVNITDYPTGIYFILLTTEDSFAKAKIVKK